MVRAAIALWAGLCLIACSGERSDSTRRLDRGRTADGGSDAEAEDDASNVVDEGDGEPSGSDPGPEELDAGAASDASAAGNASATSDASAASDGSASDAALEAGPDGSPNGEGWGPDGIRSDASIAADASTADAAVAPAQAYVFDPATTSGELPEAVASAASLPVGAAELTQSGARQYEPVTGFLPLGSALPASDEPPGLTAVMLVQWGWLPGATPPMNPSEWRDLSGYLAVGEGSIDVVRAVRWNGPTEPSAARPASGVAPQTDPRFVRFASFIGAGSEGIVVRLHRPSIKPVVVTLSLAGAVRHYTFEFFLATRSNSGGWPIPYGQGMTETVAVPTTRCYARTGEVTGTLTFRAAPNNTAIQSFTGSVMRLDGSLEPLVWSASDVLSGPYGGWSGSVGASAKPARGYFGRYWLFSAYAREGMFMGQLGEDTSADGQELFTAYYDRTTVLGSSVFKPVACDTPGAIKGTPFLF